MIDELLKFTLISLKRRKIRSWLTILGVVIGIGSVVVLISLGQGVQVAVNELFESIGKDTLMITPKGFMGPGSGDFIPVKLTDRDVSVVNRVSGVDHAFGILNKRARVDYKDKVSFVAIIGIPTDRDTINFISKMDLFLIEEGRRLREEDTYRAIMGYTLAKETFGREIRLGEKISVDGTDFSVIAINEKSGSPIYDLSVKIPMDIAREIFGLGDEVMSIFVKVSETAQIEEVKESIEKVLRKERGVEKGKEDFSVVLSEQLLSSVSSIIRIIQLSLVGIASISLVVGAIGIMNTMYTSVLERKKEIGIMKSIGATNKQIASLFLIESGIIGLVGGVVGVGMGYILGKIIEYFAVSSGLSILRVYTSPQLVLFVFLFSFSFGLLAGVMPAIQAAKLQPIEAINKW